MKTKEKKIAFLGLKGMPPRFGGLQFDAEEIGSHLVQKGWKVIVFCRKWYQMDYKESTYSGMDLKVIKSPKFNQFIDSTFHTIISWYFAYKERVSIAYFFGSGSYFAVPFLRIMGIKTIIRRNGFANKTKSYNFLGRKYLAFMEVVGLLFADVVTAETIVEKKHAEKFTKKKVYITPVGISKRDLLDANLINVKYNLKKASYILFIGRLVKVKRVEWLISSFLQILDKTDLKLVIAGDSNDKSYVNYLLKMGEHERIIFTGYVGGTLKDELISNSFCMVLPSISEGMSTAVTETLACGNTCVLSDIEVHRWILNNDSMGILFEHNNQNNLTEKLMDLVEGKYKFDKAKIINQSLERFEKEKVLNDVSDIVDASL